MRGVSQTPDHQIESLPGDQAGAQVIRVEVTTTAEVILDPWSSESIDPDMAMIREFASSEHLSATTVSPPMSISFDEVQAAARIQPAQLFDANHELLASRQDRTTRLPALVLDFNWP